MVYLFHSNLRDRFVIGSVFAILVTWAIPAPAQSFADADFSSALREVTGRIRADTSDQSRSIPTFDTPRGSVKLRDGRDLTVRSTQNHDYSVNLGQVTVKLVRLDDGSVFIERTDQSGVSWSTTLDADVDISSERRSQNRLLSDLFALRTPDLSLTDRYSHSKDVTRSLLDAPPEPEGQQCLTQFTDPICDNCGPVDSVVMYGSAILTGFACAGSFGSACAAAALAFAAASDNYLAACGACNDRYYLGPPEYCPPPVPPRPDVALHEAWRTWTVLSFWDVQPPGPLGGGDVFGQLSNVLSAYDQSNGTLGGF